MQLKVWLSVVLVVTQLALPAKVVAGMSFYAVAVGQGDSCIIQCPNKRDIIMVDMGATSPQYIDPSYITHLLKDQFNAAKSGKRVHIVISHSHTDHYSYLTRALDSDLLANVQEVILGGNYTNYRGSVRTWLEQNVDNVYTINNQNKCFGNTNCTLTSPRTGAPVRVWHGGVAVADPWQLCSSTTVKFTVLGANIGSGTENGQSIILKIKYSSWSMITSGDFEMITPQQELMEAWPASTFKSTYYKVAHHGAWTSKKPNLPALLDLIQPQKVYISQGHPYLSNFHHPDIQTFENLMALSSIVKISNSTNMPFVYWDDSKSDYVTLKGGLGRAIYETCRQYIPSSNTQVCQDIWITTDGKSDKTQYVDVPSEYLHH